MVTVAMIINSSEVVMNAKDFKDYPYQAQFVIDGGKGTWNGKTYYTKRKDAVSIYYNGKRIEILGTDFEQVLKNNGLLIDDEFFKKEMKKVTEMAYRMEQKGFLSSSSSLKPHQEEALDYLNNHQHANLWWDTGLGKGHFISSIIPLNSFIICPSHLVRDWQSKIEELQPTLKINVIDKNNQNYDTDAVNICSLQKWRKYFDDHKKIGVTNQDNSMIVIDEAHMLKNPKSQSYKSAIKIVGKFKYSVSLSATFMTNTSVDLFTNAMLNSPEMRELFGWSWWKFKESNVDHDTVFLGSKRIEIPVSIKEQAMDQHIKPTYRVKSYKDAGLEDAARIFTNIKIQSNRAINAQYKILVEETPSLEKALVMPIEELEKEVTKKAGLAFKLNQLANNFIYEDEKAKLFNYKEKLDNLKSIVETEEGKGIIFYQYKAERDQLIKALGAKVMEYKNYDSIAEFEASKKSVIIANYASIGTGIRFKKTDYIIEFSTNYDFGAVEQGRGRLRFVGRQKPYSIYSFTLQHEIGIKVAGALINKSKKVANIKKGL